MGKYTEGTAPVCVAASVVHNVHSQGTDCSALTKLAVTALPGVTPVGQGDGEGVCNKIAMNSNTTGSPLTALLQT